MKGTENTLAIILGIVIGVMMAVWGIQTVNQTWGLNTEVDNPMDEIPVINWFTPSTFEAGITIVDLGWQIFLPILLLVIFIDIIVYILVLFFRPKLLITFSLFALFELLTLGLAFWLGTLIRSWV